MQTLEFGDNNQIIELEQHEELIDFLQEGGKKSKQNKQKF